MRAIEKPMYYLWNEGKPGELWVLQKNHRWHGQADLRSRAVIDWKQSREKQTQVSVSQ